ncbi:MAG: hypothetical protein U0527_02440 [Candidatus Eisenbacteria bacterium]
MRALVNDPAAARAALATHHSRARAGRWRAPAAVRTRYFRTEGYDAWKRGTLEGTALDEDGRLTPAPEIERLGDPALRSVWSMAADGNGRPRNQDQGQVYVYDGGDEAKLLTSVYNYELFAIAPDGKGGCYVAGAPSGSIVQVGSDGSTKTLFDAPEGLVLALLSDDKGGVYAAAGERGRLYHVSASGESKVVSESGDLHLRCLAWSKDRSKILAGTDGRGLVEEIDPGSGQIRVLYDAAEEEIVDLVSLPSGQLLFAANPGEPSGGGGNNDHGSGGGEEESGGHAPSPTVYLLEVDGAVRPLWTTSEKAVHAMLREDDTHVLIATGSAGALYRVDQDGRETVLWRAEEEQVLSLAAHRGAIYIGTANPGRLYRLNAQPADDASYTSEVLDAQDQARWGALRFTGDLAGASVVFQTRSGYTSLPDDSWSAWSGALSDPLGAQITSPPGRYLQWKVKLTAKGSARPSIRRVEVAHLETNRPPAIASLSLSPDEPSFQGGEKRAGGVSQTLANGIEIDYSIPISAAPAPGTNEVPPAIRQLRSIVWDADDPDNDEMAFKLEIRPADEPDYRLLAKDLSDPAYSLETGLLPDGVYEVRLTASDAPGNAPGEERSATRVSPPFRVDNVAPNVTDLKAQKVDGPALLVSGAAHDQASPIRRLQVSVDGGVWKNLAPSDGMLDTPNENFQARVPLKEDQSGSWVVVRAQDAAGNAGTFRVWLAP